MTELKLPEVNRVLLSGRLTVDPDKRYAPDGTHVTSFSLAFHRRYRGRDGRFAEQTGFATVMTYHRLAEVCGQYLKKGSRVYVEGRLTYRKYTDKDGIEKNATDIIATEMQLLGSREGMGGPSGDDDSGNSGPGGDDRGGNSGSGHGSDDGSGREGGDDHGSDD